MYDQCVRIDRNLHVTKAGVDTKSIINLTHQVPVHGADLTYISLLVIFCISVYVTNTNLEEYHKSHTSVPVEGFDSAQQLLVVAAVDKNLCVVLHRLGQH